MKKLVQAKHVTDAEVMTALEASRSSSGSSTIWDVEKLLSTFPVKIVRAKLQALVRRKVIDGCTCGCRGDFRPYEPSLTWQNVPFTFGTCSLDVRHSGFAGVVVDTCLVTCTAS